MLRVGSKVIHISDTLTSPRAPGLAGMGLTSPTGNPDGRKRLTGLLGSASLPSSLGEVTAPPLASEK